MNETTTDIINTNFSKIIEKSCLVYQKLLEKNISSKTAIPPMDFNDLYFTMFAKIWQNPEKLVRHQIEYCELQSKLFSNIYQRFYENENEQALFECNPRDYRFKDQTWENNASFNYLKQSYIMTSSWLKNIVNELDDIDPKSLKKIEFYISQLSDALSPTNFAATNPKVIKEIMETNGENLIHGLDNLLSDIERSQGSLKIKSYNEKAFEIGKNLAISEGKVVFQNELMQLIHYKPLKPKVFEIPLLIIPPWINKFYILDLQKENSMINWLLNKGYDVYLISWANPNERLAHTNFEDYMIDGSLEAIETILEDSDIGKVNVIGYCIGGTLLTCTLSYLKSQNKDYVNSATFLTTLIDFEDAGELSLFLDQNQIEKLEQSMEENGYYEGKDMSATFDLLKANDMIWSFYVNNYLLGKDPLPFDILYWNSDTTRLPAAMHSFYLNNMYKNNLLVQKDSIILDGKMIDVTSINIPCYFLSTQEDHIAPWKNTFNGSKLLSGDVKFTLGASGHIAGVVNHPGKNKYCYWENSMDKNISADEWFLGATKHEGSWWEHWHEWSKTKSGSLIKAVKLEDRFLPLIEDAPGSYVKVRY